MSSGILCAWYDERGVPRTRSTTSGRRSTTPEDPTPAGRGLAHSTPAATRRGRLRSGPFLAIASPGLRRSVRSLTAWSSAITATTASAATQHTCSSARPATTTRTCGRRAAARPTPTARSTAPTPVIGVTSCALVDGRCRRARRAERRNAPMSARAAFHACNWRRSSASSCSSSATGDTNSDQHTPHRKSTTTTVRPARARSEQLPFDGCPVTRWVETVPIVGGVL